MKKFTWLLSIIFFGAIYTTGFSQQALISNIDLIYNALNEDQKSRYNGAEKFFMKAEELEGSIITEDDKLAPLYKKKLKKGEKKADQAKLLRIQQAQELENGYAAMYKVCSDFLNALEYPYEEYKKKANEKINEADVEWAAGKSLLTPIAALTPKELKKTLYSEIKKNLSASSQYKISSLEKLVAAYQIYLDQNAIKRAEEMENRIWQNAINRNTLNSYSMYLSEYPNGKFAEEARKKVTDLELIEKNKKVDKSKVKITYTVQILAVKKQVNEKKLRKIYEKTTEIKMLTDTDGLFKYRVGEYAKFDQANIVLSKIKEKGAFILAFKDGVRVEIKEAKTLE
ncbi:MAG TPA: hypothetical protein DCQ31_12270 [Bacteroidales bacterium]|nr:hypothetical protein [Bacteroidales bacterium]